MIALIICCIIQSIAYGDSLTSSFNNTSIYTQALKDWEQPFWTDFAWGPNQLCPEGYEGIYSYWGGTFRGNVTWDG
eukprot:CAMPEP_0185599398 /NCGR_PEP_ID=MMETSP0434-20130131/82681_1 /TAXON_ID=626734 ORGANISM="Favella taraikaensis, Strain Fe Narragansett Bay" /NCGR_SAMPLE_ID=MMETSP0434 /ASSEMBLY_ACC=CAM_ASM_000379 /LENGTH=75 /DNA_ID=CAMNT_0028228791 /DNA_START=193 /DNA_END=420 /DNA_ORIENTATION=+